MIKEMEFLLDKIDNLEKWKEDYEEEGIDCYAQLEDRDNQLSDRMEEIEKNLRLLLMHCMSKENT